MEQATTAMVMTAGLLFSCCLAWFAEELVFGAIVRWFLVPAAAHAERNVITPGRLIAVYRRPK